MNFGKENCVLPDSEWERFISEDGTMFPHCQYTNGIALSTVDKNSAVVLIGDALHSYPPDIGQGVNSGLADVVALGKALEDVNLSIVKKDNPSKKNLLGNAIKQFEVSRLAEVSSILFSFCMVKELFFFSFFIIQSFSSYFLCKKQFILKNIMILYLFIHLYIRLKHLLNWQDLVVHINTINLYVWIELGRNFGQSTSSSAFCLIKYPLVLSLSLQL